MRLKVVIFDSDIEFMNRLADIFQKKYTDKINLSIFSDIDKMYQSLSGNSADVVLLGRPARIDAGRIPAGIAAGYLSAGPDIDKIEGFPAICKYQKAEAIYKLLLNLYAESASEVKLKKKAGNVRVVLFTSAQGGSGTSAAAASYAMHRAKEKKVFYLNLEKFGDSGLYFIGDGKMSFSDVIYALQSRKGNLMMKMESALQTDSSGVDFFSSCRNVYDMFGLSDEDVQRLLQELSQIAAYEEIVVDLSGDMTERMVMLMRDHADKIVYVSDGSLTGNGKFERFCEAARVMEQREDYELLGKACLLYNRYSSRHSVQLQMTAIPVIGGIHRFEGAMGRELCEKIARMDVLDYI